MMNKRLDEDGENNQQDFALRSVCVRGEVQMPIVVWHIEQCYDNSGDEALEVVYTFPTPNGALVRNIVIDWAGQTLTGVVKAKSQAQANYDDAIENGDSAVLIERNPFGIYTANLGNLAPGETCRVQFEAVQLLSIVGDRADLHLPTVIGQRYGDAQHSGGIAQHALPHSGWDAAYPLDISIELHNEAAHFMAFSPSHRMDVSGSNPRVYALKGKAFLDRDFELQLSGLPLKPKGLIAQDPTSESSTYVSVSSFVRPLPEFNAQDRDPLQLKVLVDCSGSMSGDRIESAKRALAELLDSLTENDKIFLSKFGNSVQHLSSKLLRKNEKSNKKMMTWVSGLEADMGGTEMNVALQSVFNLGESKANKARETVTDVLLITDGEIWASNDVLRTALQTKSRVFVIAVGLSPNGNFLEVLAKASGGDIAYLSDEDGIEDAVKRVLQRLQSPQVQGITLLADGATMSSDVQGELTPWSGVPFSLYGNETLHAFATHAIPVKQLCLEGVEPGSDHRIQLQADMTWVEDAQLASTLAVLVANARLTGLEHALMLVTEETQIELLEKQIRNLAERYGLMSSQTSYVMVHERADKQTAIPVLQNVPQMMAAGICAMQSIDFSRAATGPHVDSPAEPTVWRNLRAAPEVEKGEKLQLILAKHSEAHDTEAYETPKFLSPDILPKSLEDLALEFSALLDETRETCFSDLLSRGLGPNQVEALETVLHYRMEVDTGVTEQEVCTVFILLLKSIFSELQSLVPVKGLWHTVKQWTVRRQNTHQNQRLKRWDMLRAQKRLPIELKDTTDELVRVWGARR